MNTSSSNQVLPLNKTISLINVYYRIIFIDINSYNRLNTIWADIKLKKKVGR